MRQNEPGCGDPISPLEMCKIAPIQAAATSDRLGWVGLQAERYRATPAAEFNMPALTHHWLALFVRPPQELDLRYEGVKRHVPPPAGAISLLPAGSSHSVRLSGCWDHLHIYLEPGLVAQVAAEAFDLDPARLTVPPPSWRAAAPGEVSLQAARRRHAGAVPNALKNRLTALNFRQEAVERPPYHSS